MFAWLKGMFQKADDAVDSVLITHEHVGTLVDDFFAVLRAGVVMTPNPIDDLALQALEAKVDKALLVNILVQRLRDLV